MKRESCVAFMTGAVNSKYVLDGFHQSHLPFGCLSCPNHDCILKNFSELDPNLISGYDCAKLSSFTKKRLKNMVNKAVTLLKNSLIIKKEKKGSCYPSIFLMFRLHAGSVRLSFRFLVVTYLAFIYVTFSTDSADY
jgi:hypothetical protein